MKRIVSLSLTGKQVEAILEVIEDAIRWNDLDHLTVRSLQGALKHLREQAGVTSDA